MALTTFDPIVKPSPGTSHAPEISLRKAAFGDGYTQTAPQGLNHIRRVITLTWGGLLEAQMQSIEGFLIARGGHQPFWYQPYGFTAPLKWTCETWSGAAAAPWNLNATLRQSFTLEI